jgi:predicted RNA-binding protein YlqC (UPF0109 family)
MKPFIEYVVKALVDHPEKVDIREVDGERVVVFELRLDPADVGKVIGKSGRTITAIRTLLTSAAAQEGKRAMVEIIEPDGKRGAAASEDSTEGGEAGPE